MCWIGGEVWKPVSVATLDHFSKCDLGACFWSCSLKLGGSWTSFVCCSSRLLTDFKEESRLEEECPAFRVPALLAGKHSLS